jgi:hypothetical protein
MRAEQRLLRYSLAGDVTLLCRGIGTIQGFCASNHANAICAGVAFFCSANLLTTSLPNPRGRRQSRARRSRARATSRPRGDRGSDAHKGPTIGAPRCRPEPGHAGTGERRPPLFVLECSRNCTHQKHVETHANMRQHIQDLERFFRENHLLPCQTNADLLYFFWAFSSPMQIG